MSMSYWVIDGVGMNTDKIRPYLNPKKIVRFIVEKYPGLEDLSKMVRKDDFSKFCLDEYLHGALFESLGDMLTFCDDTDCMTYAGDDDGGDYFYYPPSMPWHRWESDPQSLDDLHQRIVLAVQKVTDLSPDEILALVDDELYVVGVS